MNPGHDVDVIIVSILAERSSGGSSITDLIRLIISRGIGDNLALKLGEVVAQSLGESAATGLYITFDFERARNKLLYFAAASIPSVNPEALPGVLSVRFQSLLDESSALTADALLARGTLFCAASPLR